VRDRKIQLKRVGAGFAIASVGCAAAALIGYGMTGLSSAETSFKQDPVTVVVSTPTTTMTPLTTLQSPASAPALPPAPPAPQ
jgi:hypothetical protein